MGREFEQQGDWFTVGYHRGRPHNRRSDTSRNHSAHDDSSDSSSNSRNHYYHADDHGYDNRRSYASVVRRGHSRHGYGESELRPRLSSSHGWHSPQPTHNHKQGRSSGRPRNHFKEPRQARRSDFSQHRGANWDRPDERHGRSHFRAPKQAKRSGFSQPRGEGKRPRRDVSPPTRTHTHRETDRDQHRSTDPDFGEKVRVLFRIIKTAHHLKNASAPQIPQSIRRLTANLVSTIKPANPISVTMLLLEENAKNWQDTTMRILRDHYNEVLGAELRTLGKWAGKGLKSPFETACNWARKNLKKRLSEETLEQARALIVAGVGQLGSERDTEESFSPPSSPVSSYSPSSASPPGAKAPFSSPLSSPPEERQPQNHTHCNHNLPGQALTGQVHVPPQSQSTPADIVWASTEGTEWGVPPQEGDALTSGHAASPWKRRIPRTPTKSPCKRQSESSGAPLDADTILETPTKKDETLLINFRDDGLSPTLIVGPADPKGQQGLSRPVKKHKLKNRRLYMVSRRYRPRLFI